MPDPVEEVIEEESISAADLGLGAPAEDEDLPLEDAPEETPADTTTAPAQTAAATTAPAADPNAPPQSWAKETHAIWQRLDSEARAQISNREKQMLQGLEQYKDNSRIGTEMREVFKPYENYLQSKGVTAKQAAGYLIATQYRLETADYPTRVSMIKDLAKSFGVDFDKMPAQGAENAEIPANPALDPLLSDMKEIKSQLNTWREAQQSQVRAKHTQDVNAFASDPAHPYFDEVADDIIIFIKSGMELKDAYDRAVYANPVTREKEFARIRTETEQKLRPKLNGEAKQARQATSSNVRTRDTGRTPTVPLGSMEDTMKETLAAIKARTH